MFNPTHVEVSILEAKNLPRRKYDRNEAYVVVSIGREKFQTSIIEKLSDPIVWNNENFLLQVPPQYGKTAAINLAIFYRRVLNLSDECLGATKIFLNDFQHSVSPKLVTYSLETKSEKVSSQAEVTITIVFKEFNNNFDKKIKRTFKGVAEQIMKSQSFRKVRTLRSPSLTIRSIAHALLKTPYATPVKDDTITDFDTSENEFDQEKLEEEVQRIPSPPLVPIQSARGSINAFDDVQNYLHPDYPYETKKALPRRNSFFASSSDSEIDNNSEDITCEIVNNKEEAPQMSSESSLQPFHRVRPSRIEITQEEEDIPDEFRSETKKSLIELINKLRNTVKFQEEKINELENYIDGRLAKIMEKNPSSLET